MELKPISHFYNKRIYIVPPYQRGYSWEQKHIYDLLNDLKHAIKLDANHYTGTITIHKQEETERIGLSQYELFHIVDGQQRFTTITLILSYLIKKLKDVKELKEDATEKEANYIINKGSYLFRYQIDKVSEMFFRSIILEKEDLSTLDENLYTRNLRNGKKAIKDYFKEPQNEGKELEYLVAIEDKLKFNEYIVDSTSDIGVVFETMNNRGVGLSDLEIVKNRLLYLTSKINIKDEEHINIQTINNINTKWAQILRNLTLPTRVLNENTFLSNHWTIYNGWSKDNQTKTEILDKEFTIEKMVDNPSEMITKINNYVNSLAVTSLHWRFINFPREQNSFVEVEDINTRKKIQRVFDKLNRLSNSTVRPVLLSFFGLMKTRPQDLLELAQIAEIFSFRLFSMNKKRSDTGKNDLFRKCNFFYTKYDLENTIKLAKWYLAWYIDNHGDTDRFDLEIEELFTSSKKEGYYTWSGLVYFLYEYEESLRNNEDVKVDYEFASKKNKSIEHILPQNYKEHWKDEVKGLKKDELKRHLHSLGNLVLISADKNSSLRDSAYNIKSSKYANGTYSEIDITANNKTWTCEKIKERETGLLKFLNNRWQLDTDFCNKYPHPNTVEGEITDELSEDFIEEVIEL
ncbi:DUF262 domain-containing protein [Pedobacter sp. KBS0701]|uniref:DUF262 domain-containing protein n=1 Tax=Pedobacter sp. KBS0701 TaxID=2578106 RepID=UPI00110F21C5|nr:DUF262 domain-containing protein [Pedobacter sp. KBS0701]QDW25653.1 DUF262 domain-containing protein [Pedobacter sp. KBS0701]